MKMPTCLKCCSPLLPGLLLLSLCSCIQAWRLDCTKFVFAPRCRGVAAKRSASQNYEGQSTVIQPQSYQWKAEEPLQYAYSYEVPIMPRRVDNAHKSSLESLYNRPEVQQGQLPNTLSEAWKVQQYRKYPSEVKEKLETQQRMRAYLEAIWRSINEENGNSQADENMAIDRRR